MNLENSIKLFTLLIALLGACFGSFLNVCVWRIPRDESVIKPRSHCPSCGETIPWFLNIPVFSWIALRGKCRWCGATISFRYILLELLCSALFVMVWLQALSFFMMSPEMRAAWAAWPGGFAEAPTSYWLGLRPLQDIKLLPIMWLVVFGLLLGMFIDFEHYIIPDRVTIGGVVLGFISSLFFPELHATNSTLISLMRATIGFACGFGGLWLIGFLGKLAFKKDAMGFGDVKLMGAVGAFFGWHAVVFTVFVSSLLGSLVGALMILSRKKGLKSQIPYGPYIVMATLAWLFWGPACVGAYMSLFRIPG